MLVGAYLMLQCSAIILQLDLSRFYFAPFLFLTLPLDIVDKCNYFFLSLTSAIVLSCLLFSSHLHHNS